MSWEKHRQVENFSFVLIEKEIRKVDKDDNGDIITISLKKRFIDSAKFMAVSLSNLVDNLAE